VDDPALSDHRRTGGPTHPPGTYRVVGTDERRVTLLRVADEAGRRVHTGEVVRVARADLDAFAPAEAPPDDRSPAGVVALGYWSVRAFAGELAARPRVTVAALTLVVVGSVGPFSAPLAGSLVLAGSLLLAYVGGGRLRG
jgi:hypothetical protein